jgi:hypothetical protein
MLSQREPDRHAKGVLSARRRKIPALRECLHRWRESLDRRCGDWTHAVSPLINLALRLASRQLCLIPGRTAARIGGLEGGGREMVDILSLVLHHDEGTVLQAVELALEAGVPTKTHVLNLLHRLMDPKQTDHPEIDPPDALALETAPKANVDRYDDLRQVKEKRNAS